MSDAQLEANWRDYRLEHDGLKRRQRFVTQWTTPVQSPDDPNMSTSSSDEARLLESNTEPLVACKELFSYWRLREPLREVRAACRRHIPHDGLPHVTYIDGVGWYKWGST